MTDQATRVVPAGWYDDPASPSRVRWWNGIAWTEHVAEKPNPEHQAAARAAAERAAAEAATAQRIAEARRLEAQFGIGTSDTPVIGGSTANSGGEWNPVGVSEWIPAGGGASSASGAEGVTAGAAGGLAGGELRRDRSHRGEVPAGRTRSGDRGEAIMGGTGTASAWLIALSPLWTLALAGAAGYVYLSFLPDPIVFAAVGLIVLLTLLWAIADARALRRRGYEPASGALALLGAFVYLIARRVRVPDAAPLVVFLLLAIAVVGGPIAAVTSGVAAPLTTRLQIQEQLSLDLVGTGTASSVACPITIDPLPVGSSFTCTAETPAGARLVWVSIDGPDGEFSYALAVS